MTHRCKSKQKRRKFEIRLKHKKRLKRKKLAAKLQQEQKTPNTETQNSSTEA